MHFIIFNFVADFLIICCLLEECYKIISITDGGLLFDFEWPCKNMEHFCCKSKSILIESSLSSPISSKVSLLIQGTWVKLKKRTVREPYFKVGNNKLLISSSYCYGIAAVNIYHPCLLLYWKSFSIWRIDQIYYNLNNQKKIDCWFQKCSVARSYGCTYHSITNFAV